MHNYNLLDLSLAAKAVSHAKEDYDPAKEIVTAIQEHFIEEVSKLTSDYIKVGKRVMAAETIGLPEEVKQEKQARFEKIVMGLVSLGAVSIASVVSAEFNKSEQLASCIKQLYISVDDLMAAWQSYNETFSSQQPNKEAQMS